MGTLGPGRTPRVEKPLPASHAVLHRTNQEPPPYQLQLAPKPERKSQSIQTGSNFKNNKLNQNEHEGMYVKCLSTQTYKMYPNWQGYVNL